MDIGYLWHSVPLLLRGLVVTLEATGLGMAIASILGLVIAVVRLLRVPVLARMMDVYILFVRSTPLLVQLFFLFYVLPWYGITLSAFAVGMWGLGMHFAAYTAEVYRAGFEQVPKGQWEAARALNLGPGHTLALVIFPQALRPIVPALGNYLISMFKDSSLLATITVYELLGVTRQLAAESFQYTTLFTAMGAIYFLLAYPSSLAVRYAERRLRQGQN
ncbi:MAG TPA: ectoine/hydroxyectoine ABC transporter permease subunit EhuD [bacterium]|nr:ectoine/hydroxyectoine ABC transporter permease subunit EhuD [bacterium]